MEAEPTTQKVTTEEVSKTPIFPNSKILVVPQFPGRLAKTKKEEAEHEILETFRKVKVNIPLLDAIKQILRYAKFLKE
ncbi:hypothetical protein CRYUN_Cryun08bG0046800 [Craigia yunnanensis]